MTKITFLGAGSTIFAKNILGDSLLTPALQNCHIALYDIDKDRLDESKAVIATLNRNLNQDRATITTHLGVGERKAALKGAHFVVNAIQVGGYEPSTVIDFEIPKRFGLRQTIADTLGIGGVMRGLRTGKVMLEIARDMEEVCPKALMLNYTNPMCIVTGVMLRGSSIATVGLCHSVQVCATGILKDLGMSDAVKDLRWKVAGINHMAWLLEITDGGVDLYPEIKKRAAEKNAKALAGGEKHHDMVRYEMMRHFGFYITESSEHNAEYTPYWIKSAYPEMIADYNIPLDEYPRRCVNQIAGWKKQKETIVNDKSLSHARTHEYGSYIMEAMVTDTPYRIGGNVLNKGFIPNLPADAVVEVPCLVDRNGVQGTFVGNLPEQLAGLNRSNISVQNLTIEATLTGSRDAIYHAAYLDPHASAELPLNKIREMVDELIKAHGDYLPKYR